MLAAVQLDADEARRKTAFWLQPGFAAGVSPTRPPEPRASGAKTIDVLAVAFVDGLIESVSRRRFVPVGKRRDFASKEITKHEHTKNIKCTGKRTWRVTLQNHIVPPATFSC